jgi:hypothetical protein
MIACCGLDCNGCDAYIATKANDNNKRIEVAKNWSEQYKTDIKPEDINCNGCCSDEQKFSYCNDCEIRKCCMDKDLVNCAGCNMYGACDKLENFFANAPEARTTLDKLRA